MRVEVGWRRREAPLPPAAVCGSGATAGRLCLAVADRPFPGVEVHAAGSLVLVLAPSPDALPWVDGATWLGWECGVLVPTTLEATPDEELVARAARLAVPDAGWIALAPGMRMHGSRALVPPDPDQLRELAARLLAR